MSASPHAAPHIAGDPSLLTARQRELVALAAELGSTRFAPRAAEHDREASFPVENYRDLRDNSPRATWAFAARRPIFTRC